MATHASARRVKLKSDQIFSLHEIVDELESRLTGAISERKTLDSYRETSRTLLSEIDNYQAELTRMKESEDRLRNLNEKLRSYVEQVEKGSHSMGWAVGCGLCCGLASD
jgi:hypothetical protein